VVSIFCIAGINELLLASVRGKWLTDKEYLNVVNGLLKKGEYCSRIIYVSGTDPSISHTSVSILTEYAIMDVGLIPRWTKMHNVIENWIDSVEHKKERDLINKYNP